MVKQPQEAARKTSGPRRILVGTDFSRAARQALVQARSLAREYESTLYVLHVIEARDLPELSRLAEVPEKRLREMLGRERRERLEALLHEMGEVGDPSRIELITTWGHPFEEILKKAMDLGVGLIVLGTAGHTADLERALFGSTAEKVLRAAPCPVLCVPVE
ncbi:MAG: universal stress protein [Acidobacteria bacterium]|nr:universal stress protein [Acidobacteriota bacterium]